MSQTCPICGIQVRPNVRYPRYLCGSCAARVTDAAGRSLSLSNIGFEGGYRAVFTDTDELYGKHECYVDGIRCYADEARFGGIVVQVDERESE